MHSIEPQPLFMRTCVFHNIGSLLTKSLLTTRDTCVQAGMDGVLCAACVSSFEMAQVIDVTRMASGWFTAHACCCSLCLRTDPMVISRLRRSVVVFGLECESAASLEDAYSCARENGSAVQILLLGQSHVLVCTEYWYLPEQHSTETFTEPRSVDRIAPVGTPHVGLFRSFFASRMASRFSAYAVRYRYSRSPSSALPFYAEATNKRTTDTRRPPNPWHGRRLVGVPKLARSHITYVVLSAEAEEPYAP